MTVHTSIVQSSWSIVQRRQWWRDMHTLTKPFSYRRQRRSLCTYVYIHLSLSRKHASTGWNTWDRFFILYWNVLNNISFLGILNWKWINSFLQIDELTVRQREKEEKWRRMTMCSSGHSYLKVLRWMKWMCSFFFFSHRALSLSLCLSFFSLLMHAKFNQL